MDDDDDETKSLNGISPETNGKTNVADDDETDKGVTASKAEVKIQCLLIFGDDDELDVDDDDDELDADDDDDDDEKLDKDEDDKLDKDDDDKLDEDKDKEDKGESDSKSLTSFIKISPVATNVAFHSG